MRAFRRPVSVIAALGAVALLLTACGPATTADPTAGVQSSTDSATSSTPAHRRRTRSPPALRSSTSRSWNGPSAASVLECAKITVPMDYSKPEGETMTLAMNKLPGKNAQGSLLVNPGGPGGSGLELRQGCGHHPVRAGPAAQLRHHWLRPARRGLLDPGQMRDGRGTGCQPPGTIRHQHRCGFGDHAQSQRQIRGAVRQRTGPSLGFVDTNSAARDMDVMRALLGDKQLNYLGYSYGTSLGAHYAELFPHNVGRLVLDGAR